MDKYEISKRIENFAPLETQEDWDCSGWGVDFDGCNEIKRVMLCLTVTNDIVRQARAQNCDMIISHHPCFYVPLEWAGINIYSAHTNLDKAEGGTTDILVERIFGQNTQKTQYEYLRFINADISVPEFSELIRKISPNARIVNNFGVERLHKIAFCAGSGSEFIQSAVESGADCFVTGDLKFHKALDSSIVLYDVGHFESEILVLPVLERIVGNGVETVYAREKSPFCRI